ncbi:MAG: hypothetical protein ACOYN3_09580 [Acidimicrobiia bacterium]
MNNTPTTLVARAREAVPEGTFVVGLGMVIAAAAAYIVVIIVNAAVGDKEYAGFAVFWSLLFIVGPGLFLPLEQEVARAISERRANGVGSTPLIRKAALLGGGTCLALIGVSIACSQLIIEHLFHNNPQLLIGFVIGLAGFAVMHLVRGTCSGNSRFVPYGVMIGAEGVIRLAFVVALAAIGTSSSGPYGIAMGVAPFIAALAVLLDRKGLLSTGPTATWSELSAALALLLAGSVLAQVLAYAALLVVNVLEGSRDAEIARSFTNAFFVARIPVLMFMAVQAALLPRLARLAASDAHLDFRTAFKRLLAVVLGVAALGTVVAWTIGPFVGRLLFSPEKFQISNFDLGVLAAGSGAFIIGQTIAQALIAMKRYWHVSISLFLGCVAFGVGIAAMPNVHTTLRASAAFFAGSLVASVVMLALVQKDLRGPIPESGLDLVRSIEQEAIDI